MKKRLALALAFLMAVSMTGCKKELPVEDSSSTASDTSATTVSAVDKELVPEEGAELVFWLTDVDYGKAVAEKFKEKYGVTVTPEEFGLDVAEKMQLEGPSGFGADVFMSAHDKVQQSVTSGLAMAIDDSIVTKLNDTVNPVAMKTVEIDGKTYGIPVSIETDVLLYNKDLVKGEPAATMEQIRDEAKTYNSIKDNKFWYLSKVSDGSAIYPMLSAGGFQLFGENGTDNDNPGFDTPEFIKGLSILQSYHDFMPINSGDLTLENSDFISTQFSEGRTAYMIGGPWNIKNFRDAGVNFGVAPLPTYEGNPLRPFAYVQDALVNAFTKYPNAAQLFAEYLVSDEAASILYSTKNKITSRTDISNVEGLSEDEYLMPILEQFGKAFPMPSVSHMSYYWTISTTIGPAVFDGQMTPEEASAKAVTDWDALLKTE